MSFKSDFEVRHLPEGRKVLLREFVYDDPVVGRIVVFEGYVTGRDIARCRKSRWPRIRRLGWGRCDRAELIRDYLYNGGIAHCDRPNKNEADQIYRRALSLEEISKWRRITLYSYVSLFGKTLWKGKAR